MATIHEQGKVTFKQSFKDFWKGYVSFKGRTTRAGFWWMYGMTILLLAIFLCSVFYFLYSQTTVSSVILIVCLLLVLAIILPLLAMKCRRLQDTGLNFAFSLIIVLATLCIPMLEFVIFILCFLETDIFTKDDKPQDIVA